MFRTIIILILILILIFILILITTITITITISQAAFLLTELVNLLTILWASKM